MPRRRLVVAAVLVGVLACRDSPTASGGTVADRTAQAVAADALASIHDVVQDPLVHALAAGVAEPGSRQVSRALHAVSVAAADGLPWALEYALTTARHVVEQPGVVDDGVVRAAFGVVLDHADAMLEQGRVDEGAIQAVR